MARREILTDVYGIILIIFCAFSFKADAVSLSASATQQQLPTIVVGSPQSGDDWPISTSQVIRWARNFSVAQGNPSDVKVTVELLGEAGSQELLLDDGSADLTPELGDKIVVLRLTPPSYPATLEAIRVLVPTIMGQSDREKQITLYYFADDQGRNSPPPVRQFLTQSARVRSTGSFMDIPIPSGPTLIAGDFYVGYEIEAPAGGFTFPVDRNNTQRRTFIADRGGDEFQDAMFPDASGVLVQGNLMVRTRVNVSATRIALSPAGGVDNGGEFCWRVKLSEGQEPMLGSERRTARVRVAALINGEEVAVGQSDQFTISRALQSIRVTSPSAGEIWRDQEERIIRWTYERLVGGVRIELLHFIDSDSEPDEVVCLFDGEPVTAGQRSWEVGQRTPGFYKIRVSSSLDSRIFDDSDLFVILERADKAAGESLTWEDWAPLAPSSLPIESLPSPCTTCGGTNYPLAQTSPSIQVVTPNGGEVFEPGDRVKVTWGSQGITERVRIVLYDLSRNAASPEVVPQFTTDNTGSAEWIVPFRLSDAVKIGVLSEANPSVGDVSDGVFTIGIPGQGRLRILMPDGGEEFEVGTETRLVWNSEGNDVGDRVRIDISFDGGISYQLLCNDVRCTDASNNGEFRLGLNFPPSDRVRLRLVSKSRPWISDVTNCSFRIIAPRPPDPNAPKCPPPPR